MANTETAILAGGCFWGMQDLIRKLPGVVSTRVGYSGGDVANATYRRHGTHAEAIEAVFSDPRSDDEEPSGQRHGNVVPLGHLLPHGRAA
jgi:peptide-methionine (S)-S-oxide reductase